MGNFIEDYIDLSNGVTDIVRNGIDAGTFTNVVYRNTSSDDIRRYQAVVFQGQSANRAMTLNGNWTIELQNDGNYEGENTNQPGATSADRRLPGGASRRTQFPTVT
jgi:hypothetical protein